jgi:hypothetical protein
MGMGESAPQKRFEALAHIWGNRVCPQLLPQGDRFAADSHGPAADDP